MRIIRSLSGVLFILLSLPSIVYAYVSPGLPQGFVNDFAGVLTSETRTTLEQELRLYKEKTGNEIVVATIPALGDETIETYAVRLFEEWKLGKQGIDNGILLLVARDDRKVKIEVGYGFEGILNDAKAGRIIRDSIIPRLKEGNYSTGVADGIHRIIATLSGEAIPEDAATVSDGWSNNLINFLLEVGVFILFGLFGSLGHFLGKTKSWWLGGVIGGVVGFVIGLWVASLFISLLAIIGASVAGLLLDHTLSKNYKDNHVGGRRPWWWGGGPYGRGGGFGGGGSSFGGFGGGSSGGGGASGSW